MNESHSASYAAAGVNIEAGYEGVRLMRKHVERTMIPGVVSDIGGFGGLFAPDLAGMTEPVLVSGTDGVGTKQRIAQLLDKHDTVGIDCVAMCVNDIICSGASPLFFLDYVAVGKNVPSRIEAIVSGVTEGCRQAGCALIGGETAEMPGFYPEDEYDLAGFSVGLVDESDMIDGSTLCEGDLLIGLCSNGVHSNGFSLVRKVLLDNPKALDIYVSELGRTIGEELLRPTHIYVKSIQCLRQHGVTVKAISHITGGGLYENVPRMMKEGLTARIRTSSYPVPAIFELIQKSGDIPVRDMYNTFNMGIGLVIAIPKDQVGHALDVLARAGEQSYVIGDVIKGDAGVELV